MRDIAVTLIVLSLVPMILKYPWTGVLSFAWLSLFSPYRFAWGFAYDLQFVMIIAVVTLVSMLLHWKEVRLPINSITILLMLLPLWMTVTLLFALEPGAAYERWEEVMKKFFFALVAASLLHSRKQLEAFLWVIVLSIGFYGVKGGIFTFLEGGEYKVYGPPGESFLSDNNAIAVALIVTIPLVYYLTTTFSSKWARLGMFGAMLLSGMAILGTHSRGAFLAILAMVLTLWLKSQRKLRLGIVLVALVPLAIGFMPEKWLVRMESIETYESDTSAMGRLNTWHMLFNLANDRPLVGGGFEPYTARTFARYGPDPNAVHSAHSIYFQMLGEHGYVGLGLFIVLGIACWTASRGLIRASRDHPDLVWAGDLARAVQVSLVGFAVGGAFVNIAYWELLYYIIVVLMAARHLASGVAPAASQRTVEPKPTAVVT
jgi:probable O-glycosylation ligase (exosortase A-associated)